MAGLLDLLRFLLGTAVSTAVGALLGWLGKWLLGNYLGLEFLVRPQGTRSDQLLLEANIGRLISDNLFAAAGVALFFVLVWYLWGFWGRIRNPEEARRARGKWWLFLFVGVIAYAVVSYVWMRPDIPDMSTWAPVMILAGGGVIVGLAFWFGTAFFSPLPIAPAAPLNWPLIR